MKTALAGIVSVIALTGSSVSFADERSAAWAAGGEVDVPDLVQMIPLPPPRPVAFTPAVRSASPRVVRVAQTQPERRPPVIWLTMGSGF